MENYKEEIKTLFLQYYSPMRDEYQLEYMSTQQVLQMLQEVIPPQPIDEHDIYDVLKEMGF